MKALPLLLDAAILQQSINAPELLIIDLSSPENYQLGHVPGAINADPKQLLSGEGPVPNKLPSEAQLSAFLSSVGFDSGKQVVIYDDQMGPWAGRLLWTLDILGHDKTAVLDGQLNAWKAAGFALETSDNQPALTNYVAKIKNPQLVADIPFILDHLKQDDVVIWDARSEAEYAGEKLINCQKGGHIPGAVSFNWTRAHQSAEDFSVKEAEALKAELAAAGITADKTVVTHCQTHRRSGFTYLVAKSLGYQDIRCYDGSWFEWGNHADTPVEAP